MENFITGYPATEAAIRDALTETIGAEKAEFFFDKVRYSCPWYSLSITVPGTHCYHRCTLHLKLMLTPFPVPRILLPRRGRRVLQEPGIELHSPAVQLPAL